MKLWLLDADAIIDLLSLGLFDTLVERHEVYAATSVIGEVKSHWNSYWDRKEKIRINFREQYIDSGKIQELNASASEVDELVTSKVPSLWTDTIDIGEIESMAVLIKEEKLTFCSCDAGAISALPFLDLSERGVSVEKLISLSSLKQVKLDNKHTEEYFVQNIERGKVRWIQDFES